MPSVLLTLPMACGCVEGVVDDDGRLVTCSAGVCRSVWWCECVDAEDLSPELCDHAVALLAEMDCVDGTY
jgi:hypothetical protein